jgi:hypothetical protein
MALYGLEKIGLKQNVINFIKENLNKSKILVILDGYDEAVDGQCRELNHTLSSYGNKKKLDFDLIVTRRPSIEIDRKENVAFLDIIGFDTKQKQNEYIEKHFANSEDKEIKSVIEKVEGNWSYRQMAKTPLLLTFICLVHSQLKQGTRVELYENVIRWFIRRKIDANLAAALQSSDSNYLINSNQLQIDAQTADAIANEWYDNLEQIKRLGYLSCWLLSKKMYQFDSTAINKLQPNNINILAFTKIGLLGSDTQRPINKQTTKYQFAHQTLQEYFAAMFIVKWECQWIKNKIEYEKVNELWMWKINDRSLKCVHMRPKVDLKLTLFE